MANRERGEVSLTVAGQVYTMVLDIAAICELEDLFSTKEREATFQDILQRVNRNSVRHIRGMVWAALRRHHRALTLEQAGQLIEDAGGLVAFGEKLAEIAKSTRPDPEDLSEGNRPQKAQRRKVNGTGVTPISSRAASA